jgi:hypothetical protein
VEIKLYIEDLGAVSCCDYIQTQNGTFITIAIGSLFDDGSFLEIQHILNFRHASREITAYGTDPVRCFSQGRQTFAFM